MSIRSPRAMARAAIAITTTAALGLSMSAVANGQSANPDDNVVFDELRGPDTVAPSLDWIERELAANGGSLPSQFDATGQTPDWGLTADAVLALNRGGRGAEESAITATGLMAASINDYITGQTFGDPNGVYAGPVGKSLVTAIVQRQDPNDFGGVDLEALSRAAIQQTGTQAGRFSDQNSDFGDFSNGFGQALNVLGLSATPDGVPENAADFLLAQQCPNGGFRNNYDNMPLTRGCDDNAQADVDGSGFALQALLVLDSSAEVDEAIEKAAAWLASVQRGNGAFPNSAGTENSNTSGLVAQALAATGDPSAAVNAATWISTITVTEAETADGTPSPVDIGAIAFTKGAFDTALVSGLPTDVAGRDQWRRATTQAVLASLPVFFPSTFVAGSFGRFLDTRPDGSTVDGEDVGGGPVAAGAVVEFQIAGRGGVPDDAEAVAGNVTIADVGQRGFATVWDCSEPRPGSSSVNYAGPGAAYPNAVITKLSDEGTVCVFVQRQAQVIFDVNGFFPFGSGYEPAAGRFGDTRPDGSTVDGEDVGGGPVAAGAVVEFQIAGRGGVPDDAEAVAGNVTIADVGQRGFATVWDCSEPRPGSSSVNYAGPGAAYPNAVITKLSEEGTVCVFVQRQAQVIFDVNGFFPFGSGYEPAAGRFGDTRPDGSTVDGEDVGGGPVAAGAVVEFQIAGRGGVPDDAEAVAGNVTIADVGQRGFATVWDCSEPRPGSSSVNYAGPGAAYPNAVITKLSDEGTVCVFVQRQAQVIFDVNGVLS